MLCLILLMKTPRVLIDRMTDDQVRNFFIYLYTYHQLQASLNLTHHIGMKLATRRKISFDI